MQGADNCPVHGGRGQLAEQDYDFVMKHGLYADREEYYKKVSDEDKAWIDAVVDSFIREAPFGPENFAALTMLRSVAIDMHKERRANEYLAEQEDGLVKKDDLYDENGNIIRDWEEHPVNLTLSRLKKDTKQRLNQLGITFGEDDDGGAVEDLAHALAEATQDEEE